MKSILSLFEQYHCVQCGESCCGWYVNLEPPELQSIMAQLKKIHFSDLPPNYGFEYYKDENDKIESMYIRQHDDRCCFLQKDNLCYIHCRFGHQSKPKVCKSYPFYTIVTPKISFIRASLACTAIRSCLTSEKEYSIATPSRRIVQGTLLQADLRKQKGVAFTRNQVMDWKSFYFIHNQLFSFSMSRILETLDAFWNLASTSQQLIEFSQLKKILDSSRNAEICADPKAHLSAMANLVKQALVLLRYNPSILYALYHLLERLQIDIDDIDQEAALRYQKYFANLFHGNPSSAKIMENYLKARLFASKMYFSRNIIEAFDIISLSLGMSYLLAMASAGTTAPVDEHLMDAIYVVEKYIFHSKFWDEFFSTNISPLHGAMPILPGEIETTKPKPM